MTPVLLILSLLLIVATYLAHVRVQSMEGRIKAAQAVALEADYRYNDCADSIAAWGKKLAQSLADVDDVSRTLRMHSAQLKGAGERIRKIEAGAVSLDATVNSLLSRGLPEGVSPSREVAVQPRRKVNGGLIDHRIAKLRTEILGGNDADGLPIAGVVSDLRQQVEGINSNLGRKIMSLSSSGVNVARQVAHEVVDARRNVWSRLWDRMTGS